MSKWRDIRCDFFNEEEEKYMVDAWKTNNDSEEGTVIAKLDLAYEISGFKKIFISSSDTPFLIPA